MSKETITKWVELSDQKETGGQVHQRLGVSQEGVNENCHFLMCVLASLTKEDRRICISKVEVKENHPL